MTVREILNKIVPGLGYNHARKASASFGIEDGVITTKDFVITGKGFSMIGGSEVDSSSATSRRDALGGAEFFFTQESRLLNAPSNA